MAELKKMTVEALRDLARKALGRGHSRLKTKGELIAALQAAGKRVTEKAAATVKEATGRAARAAEKVVEGATGRGRPKPPAKPSGRAAAKPRAAEKARGKAPAAAARKDAAVKAKDRRRRAEAEVEQTEPDPDGYFVARVRGEEAVRDAPHPMTESALDEQRRPAPAPEPPRKAGFRPEFHFEEHLGDLPSSYGDDSLVALPRDPTTLFLYWDHDVQTLRNGFDGLDRPRAQLWVFARTSEGAWERIRALDFALESRSYYVHDLEPGRVYRAEIHLVDRSGREKLLPRASNAMMLPPFGPSPVVADRFMRLAWTQPLVRLLKHFREGGPFPDELRAVLAHLSDWTRFVGPTIGASAGGPGGRPGPSGGPPTSPSSPFGGWSGEGR